MNEPEPTLYDCLQICTLCHGCGQDGDEGDANGEGAWLGRCGRCDGSGLEQSSECDVIGAMVLSLRTALTASEKRVQNMAQVLRVTKATLPHMGGNDMSTRALVKDISDVLAAGETS